MSTTNYAREEATRLLDLRIHTLTHGQISLSDLPDCIELCNIVDELEEILSDYYEGSECLIDEILDSVDLDFLFSLTCF